MAALWPDTFVEEANLSFQISTLQKALGDGATDWIETVPKYGYRFTADMGVSPSRDGPSEAAAVGAPQQILVRSVACISADRIAHSDHRRFGLRGDVLRRRIEVPQKCAGRRTNRGCADHRVSRGRPHPIDFARWEQGRIRLGTTRRERAQCGYLRQVRAIWRATAPDDEPGPG